MSSPFVSVGLTVVTLLACDITIRCVGASRSPESSRVVNAQEFHLVDSEGKQRASLALIQDRPVLALYGKEKEKTPRAVLSLTGNGEPFLALLDNDGKTLRATLDLSAPKGNAPALRFYDQGGRATWSAP